MKSSIYMLLIATMLALSSAYAKDSNIPNERINNCSADLKACQQLNLGVYFDFFE